MSLLNSLVFYRRRYNTVSLSAFCLNWTNRREQNLYYSKTCVRRPLSKRPKHGFQDQLSHNAGRKYCRMLQRKHSAILSTFIKLPFVIKIIVLSIFESPFYTGFSVHPNGTEIVLLHHSISFGTQYQKSVIRIVSTTVLAFNKSTSSKIHGRLLPILCLFITARAGI